MAAKQAPSSAGASKPGASKAGAAGSGTAGSDGGDAPVTIKKYANRRLYNTATSSYVTLDHLCQMVKDGTDFVVYDAKTGDDITRSVLTQIIVEEESKGQNLLPIGFLRQLIGLYGDQMQWMVPRYLDQAMQSFAHNQDQLRHAFQNTMSGMFPFGGALEEMSKQNVAMFEQAMKMWSPFGDEGKGGAPGSPAPGAPAPGAPAPASGAEAERLAEQRLAEMQRRLDELHAQLRALDDKNGGDSNG